MRLLVKNGTLVTDSEALNSDLVCDDGVISAVTARGTSADTVDDIDEIVDAEGKLVFPGFIDPHVHSRDPGQRNKETFAHSTLGALCGGVTTILEMPNAIPPVSTTETFKQRRAEHEESAWVDFGLWGLALGPENNAEIPGMFACGAVGVKFFWGYALDKKTKSLVYNFSSADPGQILLPPENGEVLKIFDTVAKAGGLLAVHCEDRHILAASADALGHPITTYDDLLTARPPVAEAMSIAAGAEFARATGCRFHVVHMSSAAGADVVKRSRASGISVTAETCPHYLTLTENNADELGSMMKIYPPVRHKEDQNALWGGLREGHVSSIGSDHAPHLISEKRLGFGDAPAGGLGVETIAPLMIDAMVHKKIEPTRLAQILSSSTAHLYGIYPQKGSLKPGTDADMTIVDPNDSAIVRNENMHALNPLTAWDGWRLRGKVVSSILRGQVSMRDGEPVGERHGKFIAAAHGASGQ